MANREEYLSRLKVAIQELHKCGAVYRYSVPVHEKVEGQSVWFGDVEVFDLHNHPKAKRCYAWSHRKGENDKGERFVTVLENPSVVSAETAVRVQMVSDVSKAKK